MSIKLVNKLRTDIRASLKAKESLKTLSLKNIFSYAQNIALLDKRKDLQDSDVIEATIKCNKEAIEALDIYVELEGDVAQGNYTRAYILKLICEEYLPKQMEEYEITIKVKQLISYLDATTMKDMGTVFKCFTESSIKGTYNNKIVSNIIKSLLK